MVLDLSRLRNGVERLDRTFEPATFGTTDDFRVVRPVTLTGQVQKDGGKARLVGRLTSALECPCSRCLDPFEVPVDIALDLMFLPADGAATVGGHRPTASGGEDDDGTAVADDDLGVSYYTGDVIDLVATIREQFYLVLPMKPLCRDACQGLCPVCGINRNRETCTCRSEWVDPRLEPLKHLREGS
jgi:uncharacterized protein